MSQVGFMWECSCGNVCYGEEAPEECRKCSSLDSFMQLPEDIVKLREEDIMEEDADTELTKSIAVSKKAKVKTVKKTTRRKK